MSRRYNNYSRRNPKRGRGVWSYLLPFLVLIGVGLVFVLLLGVFSFLFKDNVDEKAYLHIVSGSVDVKQWGTDDFLNLTEDVLLLEGDTIRTESNGRLIVEFVDGTIVRLDGATEVELTDIAYDGKSSEIGINLKKGGIWVNKTYKSSRSNVSVLSDSVSFVAPGVTNFSVDKSVMAVASRVYVGDDVTVNIFDESGKKTVETERLAVGQEVIFNDDVLNKYWQYQSPNVVTPFSDGVRESLWYQWNIDEDRDPTEFVVKSSDGKMNFVEVKPEIIVPEDEIEGDDLLDEESLDENNNPEESQGGGTSSEDNVVDFSTMSSVAKPVLTSVSGITQTNADGFYVVTSQVAELNGTVSGAEKVLVNDYELQQFTSGSTTWKYFANAAYAHLMKPGENIYNVYAVDANGQKSDALTVKVLYQPAGSGQGAPPATQADTNDESDHSGGANEEASDGDEE